MRVYRRLHVGMSFSFLNVSRRFNYALRPMPREEFVKLFSDVFEHAYLSKIELYQGERVTCRIDLVMNGSPPTMSI